MSEIDQQFIEYVVKSLVGKPDAVQVERRIDEKGVLLELTVDPEDLGRVIGKRGATAQSLRTLLRALGTKNDARYNLKIIDNGVDAPERKADAPSKENVAPENVAVSADDAVDEPADNLKDELASAEDDKDNSASEEDLASDRLKRTRAELADLDDLDV